MNLVRWSFLKFRFKSTNSLRSKSKITLLSKTHSDGILAMRKSLVPNTLAHGLWSIVSRRIDWIFIISLNWFHPTISLWSSMKNYNFVSFSIWPPSGRKWIPLFERSILTKLGSLHIYGKSLVIILLPVTKTACNY